MASSGFYIKTLFSWRWSVDISPFFPNWKILMWPSGWEILPDVIYFLSLLFLLTYSMFWVWFIKYHCFLSKISLRKNCCWVRLLWVNLAALILKIIWYVCSIPKICPASWKLCQLIATFVECPSALTAPGVNRFDYFFFKYSMRKIWKFWEALTSIFHI